MTTKRMVIAASVLSGTAFLAMKVGYVVARPYPTVKWAILLILPWWALRLLRKEWAEDFPSTGLVLGFLAAVVTALVLMPGGLPIKALGVEWGGVSYQAVGLAIYFFLGALGSFLGAWLPSMVASSRQHREAR